MRYVDKCKFMTVAENSLVRAKHKLESRGENYADVVHDLADVVNALYEIQKDELENYEGIVEV